MEGNRNKEDGTTNNIRQGNTSTHPSTAGNRHNEDLVREPLPPITTTITTSNYQHYLFIFIYSLLVIELFRELPFNNIYLLCKLIKLKFQIKNTATHTHLSHIYVHTFIIPRNIVLSNCDFDTGRSGLMAYKCIIKSMHYCTCIYSCLDFFFSSSFHKLPPT